MRLLAFWSWSRSSNYPRSVDLIGRQGGRSRPIFQHVERFDENFVLIGRHLKHVHRLIERSVGIDVGPKLHARALKVGNEILFRKAARAVEKHMLEEVSQALLIRLLQHRAGVDSQPELGPAGRLRVSLDIIGQPVVQLADADGRVKRQWIVQIGASGLFGFRRGTSRNRRHLNRLYRRLAADRCRRHQHRGQGSARAGRQCKEDEH